MTKEMPWLPSGEMQSQSALWTRVTPRAGIGAHATHTATLRACVSGCSPVPVAGVQLSHCPWAVLLGAEQSNTFRVCSVPLQGSVWVAQLTVCCFPCQGWSRQVWHLGEHTPAPRCLQWPHPLCLFSDQLWGQHLCSGQWPAHSPGGSCQQGPQGVCPDPGQSCHRAEPAEP